MQTRQTPVSTCPGWTLKQLFRHVGRGNRWAAQIIAERRTEALDPRDVRDGKPPDDPDAAIDWLNDGAQQRHRRRRPRWPRDAGVDVHRAAARAAGGSAGACTRPRCTAPTPRSHWASIRAVAGAGRRWHQRMDRADDGSANAGTAVGRGGRHCICTPPMTGWVPPASGPSSTTTTASVVARPRQG